MQFILNITQFAHFQRTEIMRFMRYKLKSRQFKSNKAKIMYFMLSHF